MSAEFLMPVATIFRLTRRMPVEFSPNRLVPLGVPIALARRIAAPLWLSTMAFGVLSAQRERGEAVHFWQVRSLYLPDAPFRGATVKRRAEG